MITGCRVTVPYYISKPMLTWEDEPTQSYWVYTVQFPDIFLDKSTYEVRVIYPCDCVIMVDLMYYLKSCDGKPPVYTRASRAYCPHCGRVIGSMAEGAKDYHMLPW